MTKGNFALNATREIRPHENNLRFHIKIDEKYYEFAIDQINKTTVNIRCVVGKTKNSPKCYGRATLVPGEYLKTEQKICNSKKPKFQWCKDNVETDYFDTRNYTLLPHTCTKICLKSCTSKHTCVGHAVSRDKKRRHLDEARNFNFDFPGRNVSDAICYADARVGFNRHGHILGEKALSGVYDPKVRNTLTYDNRVHLGQVPEQPWEVSRLPVDNRIDLFHEEQFHYEYDDMDVFLISAELELLNRCKVYADGTFRTINSLYVKPGSKEKIYCQKSFYNKRVINFI